MIKKICVTSPSFCREPLLIRELSELFPKTAIQINKAGTHYQGSSLVEFIGDSDAIIVGTEKITPAILEKLPALRMISKYGVGVDNIDLNFLEERNIFFYWRGGVNKTSVAEMTLGFLLGLSRNLFFTNYRLRNGVWLKQGGFQLSEKTVGVLGSGHVGGEVIRLLQPFHCKILIHDLLDKSDLVKAYHVNQVDLETLISTVDFLTLHVPLTELTRNLVNRSFLQKMKKGSFLINTSRGGVVSQSDLLEFLALHNENSPDSTIAGAAVDVLEVEPETDSKIVNLPNLFVTPHIGGNAKEAVLAMGRSAIEGLVEYNKLHDP